MPADTRTFALEDQTLAPARVREVIKQFAAAPAYRSAVVDELEVGAAEYRRALRPEDLEFLKFTRPVLRETVSRLQSLASQRLLFCLNERRMLHWPINGAAQARADYRALFTPEMDAAATSIRPFLTSCAFHFTETGTHHGDQTPQAAASTLLANQIERVGAIHRHVARARFTAEAARFILTQSWLLLPMQQAALAVGEAAGMFDALPPALRPFPAPDDATRLMWETLARSTGVTGEDHRHWQFYLATSLARANLLWAFAGRPPDAFLLWGVAFAAEVNWLALSCLAGQCAAALELDFAASPWSAQAAAPERLAEAVTIAGDRYGAEAARAIRRGFAIGAELADVAMHDLALQVEWLSQIDSYRSAAALIEERIAREYPDIDRDTFIEPRDMCSTTHVHDEHRLVSIEKGDMIFWGNPGMRLDLHPGDRILIPYGRLHGSTVTSPECTYHQPIIPDDWVNEALGRVNFLQLGS